MARGPLSGRTIVVTRPRAQAAGLAERLKRAGARVVAAPLIRDVEPLSYAAVDRALRALPSYDCVVFTSQTAARRFLDRARRLGLRLSRPARLYAVGRETARALAESGWRAARSPRS